MATSGSVCEESGKDGKGRPAPPTLAHTDGDIPRGLCPGVVDSAGSDPADLLFTKAVEDFFEINDVAAVVYFNAFTFVEF